MRGKKPLKGKQLTHIEKSREETYDIRLEGIFKNSSANLDLRKEQYEQYYHMIRHHTSLSWHIPSFAVAAAILFFGMDSSKLESWSRNPLVPASGFLLVGIFFTVMLVHHIRNHFYARIYSKVVSKFEENWGIPAKVHHFQLEPEKSFLERISSTLCLSVFLILSIVITLSTSISFFLELFSKT